MVSNLVGLNSFTTFPSKSALSAYFSFIFQACFFKYQILSYTHWYTCMSTVVKYFFLLLILRQVVKDVKSNISLQIRLDYFKFTSFSTANIA